VLEKPSVYTVVPGSYAEEIEIPAPAGPYRADWIDPATGATVRTEEVRHNGSLLALSTPVHSVDIALALRRIEDQLPEPLGGPPRAVAHLWCAR
jgi:hypothetical protein